jgi:hypothetical protein
LQVIDGDQYTPAVHYGAGRYSFTREKIGTRYVSLGVRILVDKRRDFLRRIRSTRSASPTALPVTSDPML